jgi:hypothetical protein
VHDRVCVADWARLEISLDLQSRGCSLEGCGF